MEKGKAAGGFPGAMRQGSSFLAFEIKNLRVCDELYNFVAVFRENETR